jgi:DNA-binding MarR family transcriptional regulator
MAAPLPDTGNRPILIRRATLLQESLSGLIRILQSMDRRRGERYGLTASQLHALLALGQVGPMRVTVLGDHLHLEKSTASRLAKSLLKRELVRRRSPASDDRKVILQLTEQGIRLLRRILNDLSEEYIDVLEALDPEVRHSLPAHLSVLTRELSARAASPDPKVTGREVEPPERI